MAGNIAEFTDSNFESDVLNSDQPVLVDFWAPWCGPCRMIAPMIEELAAEYAGSVKVGKLNIDDSHQVAERFGISSIPTLMLFKGGQPVGTPFVGVKPKSVLQRALDEVKVG